MGKRSHSVPSQTALVPLGDNPGQKSRQFEFFSSPPQQHCSGAQPPSSALLGKLLLLPKKKCSTILNGNYHSILSCLGPVIMQREREKREKVLCKWNLNIEGMRVWKGCIIW